MNAGLAARHDTLLLALLAFTLTVWFSGRPAWLPPWLALGALLLALVDRVRRSGFRPRLPSTETALCLCLAVLYRLPAIVHPWGWVYRDGAYGAFGALHLLEGVRPAPVFTEGANYQGTLKSHIAALLALVTGIRDLSLLMVLARLVLFLVFTAATMSLARRCGGPGAALVAGVYLAIAPKFLTTFSLNCVGQYMDVLALGGLALATIARIVDDRLEGAAARGPFMAVGLLLGAAFWQQPVAVGYALVVMAAILLRRTTWRDPSALWLLPGALVGVLPVLLWNVSHGWATGELLERDAGDLRAQVDALPVLLRRTFTIAFPILSGLSPGHSWAGWTAVRIAAGLLPIAALAGFCLVRRRELAESLRGRTSSSLLPPLLLAACLALFWAAAAGRVYWRPRYLLPALAATTVHLGVLVAWVHRRARIVGAAVLALLLGLNLVGSLPRLRASAEVAEPYLMLVRSLEEKGIRTGYADFSLAAPVTMFTSERIVLSPRLGPTDAYESPLHARRLAEHGPDAYVLLAEDDTEQFAAVLRSLSISYRLDPRPFPTFYGFSRPPRLEEVEGFRGGSGARPVPEESP